MSDPRRTKQLAPVLLSALLSGCGGGCGSSGGSSYTYPENPPPAGAVQSDVATMRIEQAGVDFIMSHLSVVLRTMYPTREAGGIERAIIYLPEQQMSAGFVEATLRDGCSGDTPVASCPAGSQTYRSKVELNLDTIDQSFHAAFVAGQNGADDSLLVTVQDFDLFLDAVFGLDVAGCRLHDDREDRAALHIERLVFRINLRVDEQHRFYGDVSDVEMTLGFFDDASLFNISVQACNNASVCLDPDCGSGCSTWCSAGNLLFNGAEFFTDLLSPVIEALGPQLAEQFAGVFLGSLNGTSLATAQRMTAADLAGSNPGIGRALARASAFVFGVAPNDDTFRVTEGAVGRGMAVALDGGAYGEFSPCPPSVVLPDFDAGFSGLPAFDGTLEFGTRSEPYHLAFSVSEAYAAQLAHGLHDMGALCLRLDSNTAADLSGQALTLGVLSLLAPELAELGEPGAPLIFMVHPTRPPKIDFGTGTTQTDANGVTVRDPLVRVDLGELGVSMYAYSEEEYVRLATVSADVNMALSVLRTPNNHIELAMDELNVGNLMQIYNELAPDTDFGTLLEAMLDLALGTLVEGLGSFDLDVAPMISESLGGAPIYGRINDVRRDGGEQGYLSVYFTLCDEADVANPAKLPCYTPPVGSSTAMAVRYLGGGERRAAPGRRLGKASPARFAVDSRYEYQVRVDGVYWTGFRQARGGVLEVDSGLLQLPGRHRVELRGRLRGQYLTREYAPTSLTVTTNE